MNKNILFCIVFVLIFTFNCFLASQLFAGVGEDKQDSLMSQGRHSPSLKSKECPPENEASSSALNSPLGQMKEGDSASSKLISFALEKLSARITGTDDWNKAYNSLLKELYAGTEYSRQEIGEFVELIYWNYNKLPTSSTMRAVSNDDLRKYFKCMLNQHHEYALTRFEEHQRTAGSSREEAYNALLIELYSQKELSEKRICDFVELMYSTYGLSPNVVTLGAINNADLRQRIRSNPELLGRYYVHTDDAYYLPWAVARK